MKISSEQLNSPNYLTTLIKDVVSKNDPKMLNISSRNLFGKQMMLDSKGMPKRNSKGSIIWEDKGIKAT